MPKTVRIRHEFEGHSGEQEKGLDLALVGLTHIGWLIAFLFFISLLFGH